MNQDRTARGGANGSRSLLVVGAIAGGALLAAMLVVLILVLGELRSTRDNVAATEAKLDRALSLVSPVADEAEPLLDRTTTLVAESLPAVRDASAFLGFLGDNGVDASVFLDRLPALQLGLTNLLDDATVAAQLASAVLTDVQNQDLVSKATDSHRLLESLLAVQLETLQMQKASYRTQRTSLQTQIRTAHKLSRSLDLQRGALKHVRSLDNKTGGEFPPP